MCPGVCVFAVRFMCVSTSLLKSDVPSANPGPPQTCGPQNGFFVSVWDRLATSALLAPPQALADLQIPEPGQALHLCSPPQTKRPLHRADSSLNSLPPSIPSPSSQTGLQQSGQPLMLTSIPSIDPNEIFPQLMHDFLLNYVICL